MEIDLNEIVKEGKDGNRFRKVNNKIRRYK